LTGTRDRIVYLERDYPSANGVLIRTSRPVLVDTGFGSDLPETERLLWEAGVSPESLRLVINTHHHSDHVGGNHDIQRGYGVPVAAHRWEAGPVNNRDPEACCAEWLDQPVEPYRVDVPLADGDEVDAGEICLRVLHTPGHTLGHTSLWEPEERVLICGDALHDDDVGWINPFREGVGALERALESLDKLAGLPARRVLSGHGREIHDHLAAVNAVRGRYERWLADPRKPAWHACKRIFAYALMLSDGLPQARVARYLLGCPWFGDYARHVFGVEPPEFVGPLLSEMLRSGAAGWRDGRLVALTPHNPPPRGWDPPISRPKHWGS
jgi:glyoxylase-like metal-dependent hydrolase (beta-lactamase superfamily II)